MPFRLSVARDIAAAILHEDDLAMAEREPMFWDAAGRPDAKLAVAAHLRDALR
jgi:hypothetical protein